MQVTRDLSFGGALRYTAAYYKSPLGHDINGVGVTPDVTVGLAGGSDNQKELALETAQSLARGYAVARSRSHTRRHPRSNPRGVLTCAAAASASCRRPRGVLRP